MTSTAAAPLADADPTTRYALDVVAGEILTGHLVRLACARHLRDLEEGPARGLRWDPGAAQRVFSFFGFLKLPSDDRPFVLHPSQQFILGSVFGWKKADGTRRFVTAYIEEGKGQGKSPLCAAVGLYGLTADGEQAPEIYCAASKEEQAMVLFKDARRIAQGTPHLKKRLDIGLKNIAFLPKKGFMRLLAAGGGQSGPRPSVALVDELHEHASDEVIGILRAGFKDRRQPLLFAITNSGHDRETVCWIYHDYSQKVLTGQLPDDTWFAYVCTLDPCEAHRLEGQSQPVDGCPDCDDWRDEKVWAKANPCLGAIIRHDYLRREVDGAKGRPTEEGRVKRLNFCLWTQGETSWLPPELWSRGAKPIDRAALAGGVCCGGLDVASKIDVAAFVLCFPDLPEKGHYALLPHFWIPRATAESRQQKDGIPWLVWERQGLVTICDGERIDPDAVEEAIRQAHRDYLLESVAYDPWNAEQLRIHLSEDGIEMVEFNQSLRNYNEPTKEFEALLREGKLVHGSHPILDWMAGNACVVTDASGNVRPLKPSHNSPRKVDGVTGAVMALARAMMIAGGEGYKPGDLLN